MPLVYGVSLPEEYTRVMVKLEFVNLDWLSVFGTPPACLGSLTTQVAIAAILPLAVVGLLTLLIMAASAWTTCRENGSTCDPRGTFFMQAALRSLPVTLAIIFGVLPYVSSRIFSVFACDRFATGDTAEPFRYFVHTDYRVECTMDDPAYRQV